MGRGVARLDYDAMDSVDASTGDVIEVKGKKRTVGKCLPCDPSDEGRGVIRIDGLNSILCRCRHRRHGHDKEDQSPPAEKVVVAPLKKSSLLLDERYLADTQESVPGHEGR